MTAAPSSYGQNKCAFKIDTFKILENKNLPELLNEFETDSFKITNNKKDIPKFLRIELGCLANGFSIANPNQPYQSTDVIERKLADRQLVFFAKSDRMIVLTYLRGGRGVSRHLLMIKFKDDKITDFWTGICLNGMESKEGIIRYLKSTKPENLHNSIIYL